ncbi:MAG: HEAT repeat domain-containing protein, partial [Tepidiformaceae bacterium]
LLDGSNPSASQLTLLADLDRAASSTVRQAWPAIPPETRAAAVTGASALADDNLELDFGQLALIALDDDSPAVRLAAIGALWESTDRAVALRLTALLEHDDDESVRAAAATGLAHFVLLRELDEVPAREGDAIVEALRRTLTDRSGGIEVCARALEALGPRSLPWIDHLITEAYYDDDRTMRLAAVHAMGSSAAERWLEYLIDELHSDDSAFRFEAAVACGGIASEDAVDELAALLVDDDSEVVQVAAAALGEISGARAIEHLRDFKVAAPEGLEEAAADALEAALFNVEERGGDSMPGMGGE